MAAEQPSKGLLIRFQTGGSAPALAGGAASRKIKVKGVTFELEPMFSTRAAAPGAAGGAAGVAATGRAGAEWVLARTSEDTSGLSPWDAAHAAGAALGGKQADFIEPDLVQQWPVSDETGFVPLPLAADSGFMDQKRNLPCRPKRFAWHLDDAFSQLRMARSRARDAGPGEVVRIAHLDTGYDPEHSTFPKSRIEGEANFSGQGSATSAVDLRVTGMMKHPGHGAGTLSILAGDRFKYNDAGYAFDEVLGGAPDARIVPIRVGNSVLQLSTSSVARGINHAVSLGDKGMPVHVLSMSMGGVASQAWADAVNDAYDAGIVLVTAAGNNYSVGLFGVPTRYIVFPARFRRVIAACGVMADGEPYYDLPFGTMQGNWGPSSKMATAMAAYTPNMPWARIGVPGMVDMDGAGTSAATPQIAAAAALYIQTHAASLRKYTEPWMRVEAVRNALFSGAEKSSKGRINDKLGQGILRARTSLDFVPAREAELRSMWTQPDSASFAFFRALTGLGAAPSIADRMLELEATQLAHQMSTRNTPNAAEWAIAEPDGAQVTAQQGRRFLEYIESHPRASERLRAKAGEMLVAMGAPRPAPRAPALAAQTPAGAPAPAVPRPTATFTPPCPPFRRLRGYAIDPSLDTSLDTAAISQITFEIPWEDLKPGPVGEYIEVVDIDPPSGCAYEPVNLDDPRLLAQNGLAPSEGTPQFHQQMVYAVASLTIDNFEHALGRWALWRPRPDPRNEHNDGTFVQRLRIYPHALREANAYYSPQKVAMLFGYFSASPDDPGGHMPESRVFTSLSHDIVAHETTHALLDGMHRQFLIPSNPDVRAFHEAFADVVALFQHFTFREILRHQIAATQGDIRAHQSLLGSLATQFGRATGRRGDLRNAIGTMKDGKWVEHQPRPNEYEQAKSPHERGSFLVAAIFDAFMSIYERRIADLLRIASGGTGVLRPGAIHPDLVNRLAGEAAKSAQHVLTMCIRALDYCPPTDITFGEYLRALITADTDLVPNDDLKYRIAFVEAFRKRGIYPRDIRTLSVESLVWRGPRNQDPPPSKELCTLLAQLRSYATKFVYTASREEVFELQREMRFSLHGMLRKHFASGPAGQQDAAFIGIDPAQKFEVRAARIAIRNSPDGDIEPQLLLTILQRAAVAVDPTGRRSTEKMVVEGGSTIVADLCSLQVRYCIRKRAGSENRIAEQRAFAMKGYDSLRSTYLGARAIAGGNAALEDEPFAILHRGT